MGEIADMMIDGTMDWETGEWNFDGADGPGFPMTGAEARAYQGIDPDPALAKRREARRRYRRSRAARRAAERNAQP